MTDGIAKIKQSTPRPEAGNFYDTEHDDPMSAADAVLVVVLAGSSALLMGWIVWAVGGWIF